MTTKENGNHEKALEQYIVDYLNAFWAALFYCITACLVLEFILFFVGNRVVDISTKADCGNLSNWTLIAGIRPGLISILSYIILKTAYHFLKINYHHKKALTCTVFFIILSCFCFGHRGFTFLSFIYVLTLILAIPLGKKSINICTVMSFVMLVCHTIYIYFAYDSKCQFLFMLITGTVFGICSIFCHKAFDLFARYISTILASMDKNDTLEMKAQTDALTGTYNKEKLQEDFKIYGQWQSIAFFDIDNFKTINDTYGHDVGDKVLKQVNKCLMPYMDKLSLYRYGGDEFVVLSKSAPFILQKIMEEVLNTFTLNCALDQDLIATLSCGICQFYDKNSFEEMIRSVDENMYKAKRSGKNQVFAQ